MTEPEKVNPTPLVIDIAYLLKKLTEKQRLLVEYGGCLHTVKKIELTRDKRGLIMAYVFRIS